MSDTHRITELRLGHSPDPDDAFMFHSLANAKIDTGDLRFRHVHEGERFRPTGGQVAGALGLIAAGFLVSTAVARLGSERR